MLPIPIPALADNYIWLLVAQSKSKALCVDPGVAQPVIEFLQKNHLDLDAIFITHHHADHINGLPELKTLYPDAKVYTPYDPRIPFNSANNLEDEIIWEDWHFKILAIPGHTSTHIGFFEVNHHWLFCGDTLFSGGCGRVFDGSLFDLYLSLEKIKQLPSTTKIFCAHEYTKNNLNFGLMVEQFNKDISQYKNYINQNNIGCTLPSTLGFEYKINPFLRLNEHTIRTYAYSIDKNANNSFAIFSILRMQKIHSKSLAIIV